MNNTIQLPRLVGAAKHAQTYLQDAGIKNVNNQTITVDFRENLSASDTFLEALINITINNGARLLHIKNASNPTITQLTELAEKYEVQDKITFGLQHLLTQLEPPRYNKPNFLCNLGLHKQGKHNHYPCSRCGKE